MPIYEFYCAACHRVFHFLARSARSAGRVPACPRCGRPDLARKPSRFAVSRGLPDAGPDGPGPDLDDAALDRAMNALASEAAGLDEGDPRQVARMMRGLYEAAGMRIDGALAEAVRRMEAGEDPEAIEADLGDALESEESGPSPGSRLRGLARRALPPAVDPTLHEL